MKAEGITDLPRVTADTLTDEQKQPLEKAGNSHLLWERAEARQELGGRADAEWAKGCSAQADLINASIELGAAHERAKWQAENERLRAMLKSLASIALDISKRDTTKVFERMWALADLAQRELTNPHP